MQHRETMMRTVITAAAHYCVASRRRRLPRAGAAPLVDAVKARDKAAVLTMLQQEGQCECAGGGWHDGASLGRPAG